MSAFATRPVIMGTRGVVTSGHYLATAAGFRIMEQGGNAVDAAAAMCFCVNLLEPQSNGNGESSFFTKIRLLAFTLSQERK